MQKFGLGSVNNTNREIIVKREAQVAKEQINALNVSKKEKLSCFFGALLISASLFSGLIVFAINMMINYDLYMLFVMLLYFSIMFFIYLTNYLYLVGITQNKVLNIKKICDNNLVIYMIILSFLFMILFL